MDNNKRKKAIEIHALEYAKECNSYVLHEERKVKLNEEMNHGTYYSASNIKFDYGINFFMACDILDALKDKGYIDKDGYAKCQDITIKLCIQELLNDSGQKEQKEIIEINNNIISGYDFEDYCADLLSKNGFINIYHTKYSGDHGIDILAEKDTIKYAIQCKYYSSSVGNKAIQEAYSGKNIYDADIAVVMTNSFFTDQAKHEADKLRVKLWDGNYIENMNK